MNNLFTIPLQNKQDFLFSLCYTYYRKRDRESPREREEKTMFTITEKNLYYRGKTEHIYRGTVEAPHGIPTTETFLNAIDRGNWGGRVNFTKTDKENVYKFDATIYVD